MGVSVVGIAVVGTFRKTLGSYMTVEGGAGGGGGGGGGGGIALLFNFFVIVNVIGLVSMPFRV